MACLPTMASVSITERPVVLVRRPPGEEHMDLCFTYNSKQFKMHRPVDETLGKTLKRMLISISKPTKHPKRKHAQRQSEAPTPTEATLCSIQHSEKVVFPEDALNQDVWVDGSLLTVGDVTYTVLVNIPTVVSLQMPEFAATGGALVPEVC